jgi:hypothetical protein
MAAPDPGRKLALTLQAIGPHINRLEHSHTDLLRRLRAAIHLVLDPAPGQVRLIKEFVPSTRVILRLYLTSDQVMAQMIDHAPEQTADWVFQKAMDALVHNPDADWVICHNEVLVTSPSSLAKLARFEARYLRLMFEQRTFRARAAIGAINVGWPQVPHTDGGAACDAYAPALRACVQYDGLLTFHQYGPARLLEVHPTVQAHWRQQPGHGNGYDPAYYVRRWQRYILPYYRSKGVPIPKYVIKEFGYDGGVIPGNPVSQQGWQAVTPWGYGDQAATALADDVEVLAREYCADPQFLGLCVYCIGSNGDPKWESFRSEGVLALLAARGSLPTPGQAAPIPVPTPPAPPTPPPTPAPSYTPADAGKAAWYFEQMARAIRGDTGERERLIAALRGEPASVGVHNAIVQTGLPPLYRARDGK